jgi:hypothetical protein
VNASPAAADIKEIPGEGPDPAPWLSVGERRNI